MPLSPSQPELVAVITGDVVASSELPPSERARLSDYMREAYAHAREAWHDWLPYPLAIVGGDGWQFLVRDPCYALLLTIYFRADLQAEAGVRTRAAIAIDAVDFVKDDNLNESDGPAFRRSGRALRELSRPNTMVCILSERQPPVYQLAADALVSYADHIAQQWTPSQAQAIAGMLAGIGTDREPTQETVAASWKPEPITQQAVQKHLQKAHWERVESSLGNFEHLIQLWLNKAQATDHD